MPWCLQQWELGCGGLSVLKGTLGEKPSVLLDKAPLLVFFQPCSSPLPCGIGLLAGGQDRKCYSPGRILNLSQTSASPEVPTQLALAA